MQDDQAVGAGCLAFAKAKAEPCRARGSNDMMFVITECFGNRLIAGQKRDCRDVGGLDYYHVGCGDW